MKKYLSFLLLLVSFMLPLFVSAKTTIVQKNGEPCSLKETLANGDIACTVSATMDESVEGLTMTITEEGGAEIKSINEVSSSSDWTVTSTESGNVHTVTLASPGVTGEQDLFVVTYTPSGKKDCRIVLKLDNVEYPVEDDEPTEEPEKETPKGKCTIDKDGKYFIDGVEVTEEEYKNACPKTGSTLPYVALGVIAFVSLAAYLSVKNKAKMYKL